MRVQPALVPLELGLFHYRLRPRSEIAPQQTIGPYKNWGEKSESVQLKIQGDSIADKCTIPRKCVVYIHRFWDKLTKG